MSNEDKEDDKKKIEKMIKEFLNQRKNAKYDEEKYQIHVSFSEYKVDDNADFKIEIRPYLKADWEIVEREMDFVFEKEIDVSEFWILKITRGNNSVECVFKIDTENMIDDKRIASMIQLHYLKNANDLISYLMYRLYDNGIQANLELNRINDKKNMNLSRGNNGQVPIALYEGMLKKLYENKEEIRKMQETINKYKVRHPEEEKEIDQIKKLFDVFGKVL